MTVDSGNAGTRATTTRPRVSLFVMGTSDGAYADLCEQVLFAERLGFDGAWLAERHFANGDLFCPVPTVVLGWLAGRTSRMRLGLSARVLPFHDPVEVAEEALTLDVLTGGASISGLPDSAWTRNRTRPSACRSPRLRSASRGTSPP